MAVAALPPPCAVALASAEAGIYCDAGAARSARRGPAVVLRARGFRGDSPAGAARGWAGLYGSRPLPPGRTVRLSGGGASRGARLVLTYATGARLVRVWFAGFGGRR